MELVSQIEGLLFAYGEPLARAKIASLLKVKVEEVESALTLLQGSLSTRGINLITDGDMVTLATANELAPLIAEIRKDELNKELSKATLETLAVIVYKQGTTRSDIDYIRGVNSSFILRSLLIRGLIEKEIDSHDSRRFIYKPSLDLVRYLGLSHIEEMPEFTKYKDILVAGLGHTQIEQVGNE